jgi:hypothetical protein
VRAAQASVHPGARVVVPGAAARPGESGLGSTSDDALIGLLRRVLIEQQRSGAGR